MPSATDGVPLADSKMTPISRNEPLCGSQKLIRCRHIGHEVFIGFLQPSRLRQGSQKTWRHGSTLCGSNSRSRQTGQMKAWSSSSNSGSASRMFWNGILKLIVLLVNTPWQIRLIFFSIPNLFQVAIYRINNNCSLTSSACFCLRNIMPEKWSRKVGVG